MSKIPARFLELSEISPDLPPIDNKIYVIKNGQYISVTPELDDFADMELIQNEEMTPYQFTGTNTGVSE